MPKKSNQKLKLIKILEYLRQESDEEHPVSTPQIITRLSCEGIDCERRTVYRDIEFLTEHGYEIMVRRSSSNEYYIADRSFDESELKILLDAVEAAKFITKSKTEKLCSKIASLAGNHKAKVLKSGSYYVNNRKNDNEHIFYSVSEIKKSLLDKSKLSFFYITHNCKGEEVYKKNKERYVVNPLRLVINDDNYYLVCYSEKYGELCNYRVDRMKNAQSEPILAEKGKFSNLDLDEFVKKSFSMYTGEEKEVIIEADNSIADVIFDKFGKNCVFTPKTENTFLVRETISDSPTFIGWCFMLSDKIKVLSPQSIVDEITQKARQVLNQYGTNGR